MVELIEEAAIPVCMVGLLYALPNTQLSAGSKKKAAYIRIPSVRI